MDGDTRVSVCEDKFYFFFWKFICVSTCMMIRKFNIDYLRNSHAIAYWRIFKAVLTNQEVSPRTFLNLITGQECLNCRIFFVVFVQKKFPILDSLLTLNRHDNKFHFTKRMWCCLHFKLSLFLIFEYLFSGWFYMQ